MDVVQGHAVLDLILGGERLIWRQAHAIREITSDSKDD